eukprot:TRINITY_DN3259_c0_g1_i4.p1 TRINITY_DN3259_c0_g1~~TRINITY_DN3259_c0_g1_i4.p1  ORF type:complete len:373 (-),score=102.19 TRINITY_DN3259_c0_g1_i4:244-1362(-)
MLRSLVGSEMCIRDSINAEYGKHFCTRMTTDPSLALPDQRNGNSFKLDDGVAKRMQARTVEREATRAANNQHKDPNECQFNFYASFTAKAEKIKTTIAEAVEGKKNGEERNAMEARFSSIAEELAVLSEMAVEGSQHLPAYDQRQMQISLKELDQAVIDSRADCLPAPKFSFKSKRKAKTKAKEQPKQAAAQAEANVSAPAASQDSEAQGSLLNLTGERVVIQNEGGKDYTIKNCTDCTIIIQGLIGAVYMTNLKRCVILTGPIGAGCHVEQADECKFYIAAHQLRIHTTTATDFYSQTRSPPIIEHSKQLRFAPYSLEYPGLPKQIVEADLRLEDCEGNWNEVKDFDWLRQQHSPNWCPIPEGERIAGQIS